MVTHELRGPTHAILSLLSVVAHERTGPLTPVQRDFLESALAAARRLSRLTQDLQTALSLDHTFPLICESTDLLAVVKRCCRELDPQLQERDVRLALHIQDAPSWGVWADPIRLEQILSNLIGNAAHYVPAGAVIRLRLRQTPSRILCVVENRSEIAPDDDPALWFDMFERGPRARDAHPRGLGLGLSIVKHLVEQHGGRVFARARADCVSVAFILPKRETASRVDLQSASAAE
jgi:two-component system phosphate regulon sensor histidine kinase PhoR